MPSAFQYTAKKESTPPVKHKSEKKYAKVIAEAYWFSSLFIESKILFTGVMITSSESAEKTANLIIYYFFGALSTCEPICLMPPFAIKVIRGNRLHDLGPHPPATPAMLPDLLQVSHIH